MTNKEYKLGLTRQFDARGNLEKQWLHVGGDTIEDVENQYGELIMGVLKFPVRVGTEDSDLAVEEDPFYDGPPPDDEPLSSERPSEPRQGGSRRGGWQWPSDDVGKQCAAIWGACKGISDTRLLTYFKDLEGTIKQTDQGNIRPTYKWLEELSQKERRQIHAQLTKMQQD